MRILMIKLGAIGDVLRTTCVLRGLKKRYTNASIDWLTCHNAVSILQGNSLINAVHVANENTLNNLQRDRFDLVINLEDDWEICKFASTVKTTRYFGAHIKDNKFSYTDDSAKWFDMSLISKYGKNHADQLKKMNVKTYSNLVCEMLGISCSAPILNLKKEEINYGRLFLDKHGLKSRPIVGLNTGAGDRWRLKKITEDKTSELASSLLTELDVDVIIFGGESEQRRNERIIQLVDGKIVDAGCHNSLLEFAALLRLCDVLITSDSLALHIGYALNIRLVTFFGPTSMAEIDINEQDKKIVPNMDCLCCYKNDCDFIPNCMDNIEVARLLESVREVLNAA